MFITCQYRWSTLHICWHIKTVQPDRNLQTFWMKLLPHLQDNDGCSNVSKFLPKYMVLHPIRQLSSQPWECFKSGEGCRESVLVYNVLSAVNTYNFAINDHLRHKQQPTCHVEQIAYILSGSNRRRRCACGWGCGCQAMCGWRGRRWSHITNTIQGAPTTIQPTPTYTHTHMHQAD
jgi:hypothetical protein